MGAQHTIIISYIQGQEIRISPSVDSVYKEAVTKMGELLRTTVDEDKSERPVTRGMLEIQLG